MSSVGLVLGGGGVTGAAFEIGALMALELATGWNPNKADVVVGTSGGAFVAAILRSGNLHVGALVDYDEDTDAVAARVASHLFVREPGVKVKTWLRHGIVPGLLRPGLRLVLGSPAPFSAGGLAEWVRDRCGEAAERWPSAPTIITSYDLEERRRVAFGTVDAPEVSLADAVAASGAIPLLFRPWQIGDHHYVDGGVTSGTNADLVLGSDQPLDLVIVLAPMAAEEDERRVFGLERLLDRVGRTALHEEEAMLRRSWPDSEILVLRPTAPVFRAMGRNPMDPHAAVPTFVRTLISMRRQLASPSYWPLLERHLRARSTF